MTLIFMFTILPTKNLLPTNNIYPARQKQTKDHQDENDRVKKTSFLLLNYIFLLFTMSKFIDREAKCDDDEESTSSEEEDEQDDLTGFIDDDSESALGSSEDESSKATGNESDDDNGNAGSSDDDSDQEDREVAKFDHIRHITQSMRKTTSVQTSDKDNQRNLPQEKGQRSDRDKNISVKRDTTSHQPVSSHSDIVNKSTATKTTTSRMKPVASESRRTHLLSSPTTQTETSSVSRGKRLSTTSSDKTTIATSGPPSSERVRSSSAAGTAETTEEESDGKWPLSEF